MTGLSNYYGPNDSDRRLTHMGFRCESTAKPIDCKFLKNVYNLKAIELALIAPFNFKSTFKIAVPIVRSADSAESDAEKQLAAVVELEDELSTAETALQRLVRRAKAGLRRWTRPCVQL